MKVSLQSILVFGWFFLFPLIGFGQTVLLSETLTSGSLPSAWTQSSVTFTTAAGGYANFTSSGAILTSPVFDASAHTSVDVDLDVAKFGTGGNGPITVEYSTNGGSSWMTAGNTSTPTSSTYLSSTISIAAVSATMRIRFTRAASPSQKRVKNVVIKGIGTSSTATITTSSISGSPFCVGNGVSASVSVPFTITGTFAATNDFAAELSDGSGSFASPTVIGTLDNTSTAGTISAIIPASVSAGTGYRIRVVGNDPSTVGSDNGTNLVVSNFAAPTSFAASCGNGEASATWTNPGCFDEVMVVASSSAFTTDLPTGNGSAYSASLTFGSGTTFDGGSVVYKGTGIASGTITALSNGTTYYFKLFARKGTNWSVASTVETCTPENICGSESFDGLDAPAGSYGASSYTGDNTVSWAYNQARTVTSTYNITGTSIGFSDTGAGYVRANSGVGGVGVVTFSLRSYFTGGTASDRTIEVYVNGSLKGTYTLAAMGTVYTETVSANETGDVLIEFRSTGSRQIVIDDVSWTCYSALNTISTSSISGSPFCVGNGATASISVPYTVSGTFNGSNIFTAQLSNSSGSFTSPTDIGTLSSTTDGTISAIIPASVTAGTGYRIRVVSDDPATIGTDNGTDLEIRNFAAPTSLAVICGNASADVSWVNPACFDEVMVVASSSTFTSALPSGSSYSGNLSYGSGDSFDGGSVVYVGVGTSTGPITSLVNGTAYNFKIFARSGTTWLTGSTESCTPSTDLFVSEYIEGSANNKAIEIYNATGVPADLSNYEIRIYSGGSSSPTTTIALSGTLNDGNVYVVGNVGADSPIILASDLTTGSLNFNGNDAVVLYNNSTSSYSDIIGNIGCDPGTDWSSGAHATSEKTLVRKITVCEGVKIDPSNSPCDFPTLVSEWLEYPLDDFSYLGAHSGCNTTYDITTGAVSTAPFVLTSCTDTETGTVAFTSNGVYNTGNVYSVQISDEDGDFGSELVIGSISSTANSGIINITIPAGIDPGTGYRVRVISSDPDLYGSQSSPFTISTSCVPEELEPGDFAILAFNTNVDGTFGYDELSFVSFIDVAVGTVIDFTDNAYEKCGTVGQWGISEGWIRLVRTTNTLPDGEVITIRVVYGNPSVVAPDNNWNVSKPQPSGQGNFDLNADGEQVFLLSGGTVGGPSSTSATSDAGTYNGDVLYGFNTKGNIWTPVCGNAAAGGTKNSAKPIDFDCFLTWPTAQADKNKYTGPLTPASQRDWLYRINNPANWTGYSDNASYEAGTEFIDFNGPNAGRTLSITSGGFSSGLWTGETDNDWHNCSNWQSLRVPDVTTDVTIPSSANNPRIFAPLIGECNTIQIETDNGAKLQIENTAKLKVHQP